MGGTEGRASTVRWAVGKCRIDREGVKGLSGDGEVLSGWAAV